MKFWIDFQRVKLLSGGFFSSGITRFVFPALVAIALSLIFVLRGFPEKTVSNFIFFSTLYLFWLGLFNSCTVINGAKESGEWSYWVLGLRQGRGTRISYVNALLLLHILQIVISAIVFCSVVALTLFFYQSYWAHALGGGWALSKYGLADPDKIPAIYTYFYQRDALALSCWAGIRFVGFFLSGLIFFWN